MLQGLVILFTFVLMCLGTDMPFYKLFQNCTIFKNKVLGVWKGKTSPAIVEKSG